MSAGAIGGCSGGTPPWADVRQAMGEAQADKASAANDGGQDGVGHARHGGHGHRSHHGRGHGLVQAIRQVLEKLGMDGTQTATEGDPPAVTDTTETQAVADAVTAADGTAGADAPAEGTDPAAGSAPSAKDVRHALHAFIHTLFQTLSQGGSAVQATGGPDADGDNDGCTGPACGPRAGYRNPGTDLSSLVQGAGTDGTDGTGGTDGSGGTAAGLDLTALNTAFQDLVSALGGDPSNPAVTLQAFLQGLLDHLTGASAPADATTTPPVGALVTTTA